MSATAIIKDIKSGNLAPIYLLMGEEPFYIDQISKVLEKEVIPEEEKGFCESIVYGLDTDIQQVIGLAKSFPMMGSRQLVMIKEAQHLSKSIQQLSEYAKQPTESTVLVIEYKGKKIDQRTEFCKVVKSNGVLFNSEGVPPWKLNDFIKSHSRAMGLKLNPKHVDLFAEYIGNDLGRINSEFEKLKQIVPSGEITDQVIEEYVGISNEYNIVEFQKAVLTRNMGRSMKIASHFASSPKSVHIIPAIGSLYKIFSNWIKLHKLPSKSEKDALSIGITRFYYKEYMQAMKAYTVKDVVRIMRLLLEYDLKAKGLGSSGHDSKGIYLEMVQRIVVH